MTCKQIAGQPVSEIKFNWNGYDTDKLDHGYQSVYDKYFENIRNSVSVVVEIGSKIGSAKLWLDYFPNAKVYSVDFSPVPIQDDRHKYINLNQSNVETYKPLLLLEKIDILIDDGPHTSPEQLMSIQNFLPKINKGGFYVIEDLHVTDGYDKKDYKKFIKDSDITVNQLMREWKKQIYNNYKYIDIKPEYKEIHIENGTKIRWTKEHHGQDKPSEIIFIEK